MSRYATTHTPRVSGVNQTAYRSASRCSGDLLACARRTSSTMRAYWLSPATAVARTVSEPSRFALPLMSRVPAPARRGIGSPVRREVSRCEVPSITSASHGTSSPGRMRSVSPTATCSAGMSSITSRSTRWASRGAASSRARTASDAFPSA